MTKNLARSRQRNYNKLFKDQTRQAVGNDRGGDHKEEREDWPNRSMRDIGELATTRARHRGEKQAASPLRVGDSYAGRGGRRLNRTMTDTDK